MDVKLLRRVILFDSAAQTKKDFQSSATTWVDLKIELTNMGVSASNCKFIEGATKLTIEQDSAALPMKDFVIFKVPVSTKSAATLTSNQCKELIKAEIAKNKDAKTFFAGYSSMKVADLQSILKKWETKLKKDQSKAEKVVAKPVAKETTPKAKPVAKKVEAAKPAKPTAKVKESVGKVVESVKKATSTKAESKAAKEKIVTPKWLELIQQAVDIAPTHVASELNYIISKELEIPVVTDDVKALAAMARQLK